MHWSLWMVLRLDQARLVNCNQILGHVAGQNSVTDPGFPRGWRQLLWKAAWKWKKLDWEWARVPGRQGGCRNYQVVWELQRGDSWQCYSYLRGLRWRHNWRNSFQRFYDLRLFLWLKGSNGNNKNGVCHNHFSTYADLIDQDLNCSLKSLDFVLIFLIEFLWWPKEVLSQNHLKGKITNRSRGTCWEQVNDL